MGRRAQNKLCPVAAASAGDRVETRKSLTEYPGAVQRMARRSGRTRESRGAGSGVRQLPWREVTNPHAPFAVLSEDQVEAIHRSSLRVLSEMGMRVLYDEARRLYREAGAYVDDATKIVRFDPAMVEETIRTIPPVFSLRARNPQKKLILGANHSVFSSVGGPAYVTDLDRGRRSGTYADQCEYLKLVQSLNIIHQEGGGPFEAMDLPPETRHLDLHLAQVRLLDKHWQAYPLGRERTVDGIEMMCLALQCDREALAGDPAVLGIVNTNSPLQFDIPMSEATIELASANQAVCVTPFTLSGAMAPATIAGTLTQMNAEVLAVAVLTQIIRPGAPVMYGSFSSNVDMRSGSPAFGTPEYTKGIQASAQLARRYGMPFRCSNTTASNCVDGQAVYESAMSLWGCITAHTNLIYHAAGWLESGLTASYEKLIMDAEMLQMLAEYLKPVEINEDTLGLDAIKGVGHGGHFFGAPHTLARYETAFYSPMLSDWRNFERWQEAGGLTATQRANGIWKKLVQEYEQPPLDPAIDEALVDYVARRKEVLGS